MKKTILITLMIYSTLSYSMHENAQPESMITWQAKQYKVTHRVKTDIGSKENIIIAMERPSITIYEMPLAIEQVTCTYTPTQSGYQQKIEQHYHTTGTGWLVLASSIYSLYQLTNYCLN